MPFEEYTPIIGKNLLDSLVLKLYSESLSIYREYIQNACDSIYEAVKKGILESVDKGCVAITIKPHLKRVSIRDNGTGISTENAVSTLMDIYHGSKDGITSAGQYGIGRLSGGGYCRKLIFATSVKGEDKETRLTIDVERLRSILKDDNDDRSAEDIMKEICSVDYSIAVSNDHYLEVTLEDVFLHQEKLLDVEVVKKYVQLVAPIDYTVSFKQLMKCSCNNEWSSEEAKRIRHINVSVNEDIDIKKGYGYVIKSTGDAIESLRFFRVEDRNFGQLAWGWYAVTPFTVAIPETDPMRGIQLRKHNIALDRSFVDKLFSETRGNSYFYGEIFINNNNIVPNSGRDGLAPSAEAEALSECLKKYFKTLKATYTLANTLKNRLKDLREALEKFYGTNFRTDVERKTLVSEVSKYRREFVSKTDHNVEEKNDVGRIYLYKYQNEEFKDGKSIATCAEEIIAFNSDNIETQTQHTYSDVEKTELHLPDEPTSSTEKTIKAQDDLTSSIKENEPEPKGSEVTSHEKVVLLKDPIEEHSIIKDEYQILEDYGYDQGAINVIRKAYGFVMTSCPKHLKGEMREIINKAIGLLKDN